MNAHQKWHDYQVAQEKRRVEDDRTGAAIGAAIMVLLFWPPLRMAIFLAEARNRDLNYDGVFSIGDIMMSAELAYTEPAHRLLSMLPPEVFSFFETSVYSVPGWMMFVLSVAAWIAIAIVVFHVARLGLTILGYAGKGMTAIDARMKGRFSGLLTGDIIVGGLIAVVVLGITLGAIFGR